MGQTYKRLTYSYDHGLFGKLVDLWGDSRFDTRTLVFVCHGRAVKRSVWSRPKGRDKETDEVTRPLTRDRGETWTRVLVPVLAVCGVGRAITNPWRCYVDTVAPCAAAAGLGLEMTGALTETAHVQSPKGARPVVKRILRVHGELTVLCAHRPVLFTIMEITSQHTPGRLLRPMPDRGPWLKTDEILVVHTARRPRDRIRAVAIEERHPILSEGR